MGQVDQFWDNYMWFPKSVGQASPVVGETTDQWFQNYKAFELSSFSFKMNCDETVAKGKAGKAHFGAFTIKKPIDLASVPLYMLCSQGMIVPTIMLAVRKAGGDQLLYLQYVFRYNQVTDISWDGGGGDKRPEETMVFTFKAMGMQYIPQDPDGRFTQPPKTWSWNTVNQGAPNSLDITGIEPAPDPPFLPGTQALSAKK